MARSVPEWCAKHDDQAIPDRVKLRVMARDQDRCAECGNEIVTGDGTDFDHAIPLADGGEHRETNLRPVHRKCHRMKTAREAQQRAEARTKRAKALGIKKSRHALSHPRLKRRMDGTVVDRSTGEPV